MVLRKKIVGLMRSECKEQSGEIKWRARVLEGLLNYE
jgi:hypothetical protein